MVMRFSVKIKALKKRKAIADKMRSGAGHKLNEEEDMTCCMLLWVTGQQSSACAGICNC